MLLGQNFGRRHHGGLVPVLGHQPDAGRSHHGFSAAHIPLEQSVHRGAAGQIRAASWAARSLGPGELEGQGCVKGGQIAAAADNSGPSGPPFPHQLQSGGEVEQLLKDQPPPGDLQLLPGGGKVDGAHGPAGLSQLVPLPDRRRQILWDLIQAVRQNPLHRARQEGVGDPLSAPGRPVQCARSAGRSPPGQRAG